MERENKLIAEFMGGEFVVKNIGWEEDKFVERMNFKTHPSAQPSTPFNAEIFEFPLIHLQYHSSWDWLMPVVLKIEEGNYGFKICRKVVEIYIDDTKETIIRKKESSKLESLFSAVVEFVQNHNK